MASAPRGRPACTDRVDREWHYSARVRVSRSESSLARSLMPLVSPSSRTCSSTGRRAPGFLDATEARPHTSIHRDRTAAPRRGLPERTCSHLRFAACGLDACVAQGYEWAWGFSYVFASQPSCRGTTITDLGHRASTDHRSILPVLRCPGSGAGKSTSATGGFPGRRLEPRPIGRRAPHMPQGPVNRCHRSMDRPVDLTAT